MAIRLITVLGLSVLISACDVIGTSGNDVPPSTSVSADNARPLLGRVYDQMQALSHIVQLTRDSLTIISNPGFCSSGSHTSNQTDNTLETGDVVNQTFTDCVLASNGLRVSGSSSMTITRDSDTFNISVTHTNLSFTPAGANQLSFSVNGRFNALVELGSTDNNQPFNMSNIRNYVIQTGGETNTINAGGFDYGLLTVNNTYSIRLGLTMEFSGIGGIFRAATSTALPSGSITNNAPTFPFTSGRVDVISVQDNDSAIANASDGDNNSATFQLTVRDGTSVTSQIGVLWADL